MISKDERREIDGVKSPSMSSSPVLSSTMISVVQWKDGVSSPRISAGMGVNPRTEIQVVSARFMFFPNWVKASLESPSPCNSIKILTVLRLADGTMSRTIPGKSEGLK